MDADPYLSAAHQAMIAQLTGPLAGGATDEPLELDAAGRVTVPGGWEPLLLAAPAVSLRENGLRLECVLDPDGAATPLPGLTFAAWTEAGAYLPLRRPVTDPATRTAQGCTLALRVRELRQDGFARLVPVARTRNLVRLSTLHGVLGRVLYLLAAEKARLRRQSREIQSVRQVGQAFADALDRHGADLGVARFAETLAVKNGQIVTLPAREADSDYRRRLSIYRPWLLPTRSRLLGMLNGPGDAADPNAGPLGEMGLPARFVVEEDDNELAVSMKIVGVGAGGHRDGFLRYVREAYLIWPLAGPVADGVHARRFVSAEERARQGALRAGLRAGYAFTGEAAADPALAPQLAAALIRLARCRTALSAGPPAPWPVRRAQRPDRGSRYELGLGCDLAAPSPAELDALAARAADPARPPAQDAAAETLLRSLSPMPAAQDPEGRWLLAACGLRTVHRLAGGDLYVSTLPTYGLTIEAPDTLPVGGVADVAARHQAPGDPGANAVLAEALARAAAAWAATGAAAWSELSDADARAQWTGAQALPAALTVFAAASLPAVQEPAPIVERLARLPAELLVTVRLDPELAQPITTGDPAAADTLRTLVAVLETAGIASVLPLVTPRNVLLILGVVGLPGADVNLAPRRSTGFRWYVVPLGRRLPGSDTGRIGVLGARTRLRAARVPGVFALVTLGYARRGRTDPYEHRVDLPDHAVLSLLQYEFTMNLLEHCHPAGVEVNTYALRRRHVDLDGDGDAEPLNPALARTFRIFRRRHRGEAAATFDS